MVGVQCQRQVTSSAGGTVFFPPTQPQPSRVSRGQAAGRGAVLKGESPWEEGSFSHSDGQKVLAEGRGQGGKMTSEGSFQSLNPPWS